MQSSRVIRISPLIVLFYVVLLTARAEFDAKRDVFYEMHCRFSNGSTNTTLYDIDTNILQHSNFIETDDGLNRVIQGVTNCRWNWHPARQTRIFVHGYYSNEGIFKKYVEGYLNRGDFNFIGINWLKGARTINYVKARHRVREVGEALARFIDYLVTLGLNLNELIMVGHSLGSHICGIAGKNIKSGKPLAIIGLDPALPLFQLKNIRHRLYYDDARYVQVIHTSGGYIGVKHPIGHADFYPNFGCVQPSCQSEIFNAICSHGRAEDFFVESLKTTSEFWGTKCGSYAEIYDQKCQEHGVTALMGGDIENMEKAYGLFYLQTNDNAPYALIHRPWT